MDKYERDYSGSFFETTYQMKFRRRKVLEIINSTKHDNILEIGCGLDSIGKYIDNYEKIYIVEPIQRFCKKAEMDLQNDNIKIINGLFEEKAHLLMNQKYDMIIVSSLLHELEDPRGFLLLLKNICQKDTLVHVNVPNKLSIHRILAFESGIIGSTNDLSGRNVLLQQNKVYDIDTISKLISEVGGVIRDKGTYFIKPFSHSQMEKCIEMSIINENILEGFYNIASYFPENGSEIYVNFHFNVD